KIDAIDTPYTNVNQLEGLKRDALIAKGLGMNAKACIHPNQIDMVNQIFSPTKQEILKAQKIIAAYEQEKKGAFSLDGKMIDKPIIERSMKVIAKANKFGLI
ncbi:MAG: HpcH/HpaI aldolase/citrate lyase family protein, partial [Bacilli bacterium]